MKPVTAQGGVAYLDDQHTHGDGSDQVLVVIKPVLHFVIATLGEEKGRGQEEEAGSVRLR